MNRRRFLVSLPVLTLSPLPALLSACGERPGWPEGMAPITFGRDTCSRCNMVLSDPRFAAQIQGGEPRLVFRFDDIGCLVFWLRDQAQQFPWMSDRATSMWVGAYRPNAGGPANWLDPRRARFISVPASPMGYKMGAVMDGPPDGLDFETMRQKLLAPTKQAG